MRGRAQDPAPFALSIWACLATAAFGAGCSPGDPPATDTPTDEPQRELAIATWLRCEECVDGEREGVLAVGEAAVPALRDALLDGPPEEERLRWEADMRGLHARIRTQADNRGLEVADVDEFAQRRVENLVLRYRVRAAEALGWIGGPGARDALEEAAGAEASGGRLRERIRTVLDSM